MSYFNSFTYIPENEMYEVAEGEYRIMITKVEAGKTKQGYDMVVAYCKIDSPTWNGVEMKQFIIEGEYFDKTLSTIKDCFGLSDAEAINPNLWFRKIGKARFDHWKYDSTQKKNIQVQELQCHLLRNWRKKEQPAQNQAAAQPQPTIPQQPQPQQPQIPQNVQHIADVFGGEVSLENFPEQLPF